MSDSEDEVFPDSSEGESDIETDLENHESDEEDNVLMEDELRPRVPWFRVFPPEDPAQQNFEEVVGPQNMPHPSSTPVVYFYLFMTAAFIQRIVTETNRYAWEFIGRQNMISRCSRLHGWAKVGETTVQEIKGFLSVILNMGLIRKPSIAEYWNCKLESQETSWFKKMFSRNRFQSLLKFFHLVDNSSIPNREHQDYNPAAKFQPIIDLFNDQAKLYLKPNQTLSIDESLIGTRGRTCILQYIPSKSSKFGVKVWMLAEAITGYIFHAKIYRGRKFDKTPAGRTQGFHVVHSLMTEANLLRRNYHVICDSFFTSIELARELLRQGTFFTGTLRSNRFMPNMIKNITLAEREFKYVRQGDLMICAYRERKGRKPVRVISTRETANQDVNGKPKVLDFYNKNMGGVDLADQMVTSYNDNRKCLKVWRKVAFNFIQRMVINAYILYCKNTSERPVKSRLQFTQSIVEALASEHLLARPANLPNPPRRRVDRVTLRKINKYRDCSVCSDRDGYGGRHRTKTVCRHCDKGLHKDCVNNHVCIEQ